MTGADRCQACALVTGGLWLATGSSRWSYITVVLLWMAIVELTSTIRAQRRAGKSEESKPIETVRQALEVR